MLWNIKEATTKQFAAAHIALLVLVVAVSLLYACLHSEGSVEGPAPQYTEVTCKGDYMYMVADNGTVCIKHRRSKGGMAPAVHKDGTPVTAEELGIQKGQKGEKISGPAPEITEIAGKGDFRYVIYKKEVVYARHVTSNALTGVIHKDGTPVTAEELGITVN